MTVYYEDDDVVVCEKPYGVSSQENDGENMVNLLKTHLVIWEYTRIYAIF